MARLKGRQKMDGVFIIDTKEKLRVWANYLELYELGESFGKKKDRKGLKKVFRVLKDSKSKLSKMFFRGFNTLEKRVAFKDVKRSLISMYRAGLKNE